MSSFRERCELLSKTCIFDILNNYEVWFNSHWTVVNCFQKLVSLIFWTTFTLADEQAERCELLSKTCIFDILNNCCSSWPRDRHVVNCFQKLVSLIFWTTLYQKNSISQKLWIAFKNLYLWYSEQQKHNHAPCLARCELLSKTCIFDILNNIQ